MQRIVVALLTIFFISDVNANDDIQLRNYECAALVFAASREQVYELTGSEGLEDLELREFVSSNGLNRIIASIDSPDREGRVQILSAVSHEVESLLERAEEKIPGVWALTVATTPSRVEARKKPGALRRSFTRLFMAVGSVTLLASSTLFPNMFHPVPKWTTDIVIGALGIGSIAWHYVDNPVELQTLLTKLRIRKPKPNRPRNLETLARSFRLDKITEKITEDLSREEAFEEILEITSTTETSSTPEDPTRHILVFGKSEALTPYLFLVSTPLGKQSVRPLPAY